MFKKLHDLARNYVQKDFVHDKFDGIYPFGLNDLPNLKYKSFGEKNPYKVFFVIYRTPYEAGFFSNFVHVLRYLKMAEDLNLIPVVDFENFKTFYNNDKPINGTKNSWEYYFEQPSPYSLEEVYQSKNVLFCDGVFPHSVIMTTQEQISEYCNKAFKIKPHIAEHIKQYDKFFEGNKVLGIHFRGKDLNIFPGHPFGMTEKQVFKYADEIIEKFGITKIFAATNEKKYMDLLVEKYGDMVFFADNLRTEKTNEFNMNPRENHRYLLGLEVLTDAILLSKCNGLLHGHSNIIHTATLLNENLEFSYFVDNGMNVKNKYRARYLFSIKKRLPKGFGGLADKVHITLNKEA